MEGTGSSETHPVGKPDRVHDMNIQESKGRSVTKNENASESNQNLNVGHKLLENDDQTKERNEQDTKVNIPVNENMAIDLRTNSNKGTGIIQQGWEEEEPIFADTSTERAENELYILSKMGFGPDYTTNNTIIVVQDFMIMFADVSLQKEKNMASIGMDGLLIIPFIVLPLFTVGKGSLGVTEKSEDVLRETSLNTGSIRYPEDAFLIAGEESRLSIDVEETEKHLEVFQTLKESFLKAYKVMDRELRRYTNINCFYSGTTAVTLVKQGKNLAIGNIGDSRAVLATRDDVGCFKDSWLMFGTMDVLDIIMYLDVAMFRIVDV
ncbi:hypothetical protein T459_04983 [Capsicum annuum]|uniref:PPM-type phosphatase domain-containing protein n=1 Tax=Capsicum annuum TaxID=4072 RepID=A0A2G3A6R3_CAPAN|nr:hypothetical protein T459_04983 [Capsicum annuum]